MITSKQYDRLPKYAQRRIEKLEADAAYWKEKARQVDEGDTNVWLWQGIDDIPLPRDSKVRFSMNEDRFGVKHYIDVSHNAPGLDAIYIHTGIDRLVVVPVSSNTLKVRLEGQR